MKKLAFTVLALFAASALMLAAPLAAKTGFASGFKRSFGMNHHFMGHHPHGFAHNHFRRFAHNRFLHRHHNGWWQSAGIWGAYWPWTSEDWPFYGSNGTPVIYQAPTDNEDITGSLSAPVVHSQHSCSAEHVKVPSEQGGETMVTVIRC